MRCAQPRFALSPCCSPCGARRRTRIHACLPAARHFQRVVGLDVLADKLVRQRIAATVYSHDEVSEVATLAAQQYRGARHARSL